MKTHLKLSDDFHTMTIKASSRKGLQKECNRLTAQVGWELDTQEVVEGDEYPFRATMLR